MKTKKFLTIILLTLLLLLLGCAKKSLKTIEGDPALLYREGLVLFNKRDYPEALKKFELLKSNFPDSPPFTIWAELKIGDCHFFQKEYVEAIATYEEFKKIHPSHEEIPYVIYQIGMAYFNQILSHDRDQTFTQKALSNFEYLMANYPPSVFTEKIRDKIDFCRKRLADHEFYIGNYYYKNGKFKAASARFQGLIEKFPKMPEEDKILFFLGKSYLELDQREKAVEALNKIVSEYPKSSYYKEAKGILDQGIIKKITPTSKTTTKKSKKLEDKIEPETEKFFLARFDDEKRKPVSFTYTPAEVKEPLILIPPMEEIKRVSPPFIGEPIQEDRAKPLSLTHFPPPKEVFSEENTKEENQVALIVSPSVPSLEEKEKIQEKEKTPRKDLKETNETKPLETGQPIDIISDKVETYSKENLILFKGNVMARQKDMVIYSDSLEAVITEGGKGIEKVVAGWNVKIQQGIRVANCQKAVFYNIDQKLVLTGEPKVWEGSNMVSGDEIVFYIEQNRIEVKGGLGGRGKAKIHP